jgi:eukaryotic-like serine/threonine-protein kinase
MGTPTETALSPGVRLAHYELRGQLGSGAMGTVYRAHDTSLDRDVAVKVLRSRLAEDPAVVDRFVREARAAARVNHPNLTHIYFVGNADGQAAAAPRTMFFAMEYVPGATFEQDVAANGPAPIAKFVDMIVQAARGLAAAHGAGVVHRDVKPSNLMVLPDGTVKVTDFGLAKSLGGNVDASGDGSLLGTPTYMSPEQCRGRGVDARTDVYALGLTAWFLLAGRAPFASESLGQMLQDQMNSPLPPIRDVRPELPPALERALAYMCEKDPAKRPASMEEVAALFEPFRPRPLEPATFMARAFASAIDLTVVTGAFAVAGMSAAMLEKALHVDVVPEAVFAPFFAALLAVWQLGAEAWLSTTFGKWLFNLEVARADGGAPRRTALLLRFLVRYPAVVACFVPEKPPWLILTFAGLQAAAFVLAAAAFIAYGRRTLSDLLTRTRVVYRSGR